MVEIAAWPAQDAERQLGGLADLLLDAVADGAGVGFLADISRIDASAFWAKTIASINAGDAILFAALQGADVVGAVLLHPCAKPNQPHRADVAKLLVHSQARRLGIASCLMNALEAHALSIGRTLLTLDTATGSGAEDFYRRRGYKRVGEIPGYALMPDGAINGTTLYYKQLS